MTSLYYEYMKDVPDSRLEDKFDRSGRRLIGMVFDGKPYRINQFDQIFIDFFCKNYQKCDQTPVSIQILEPNVNIPIYTGVIDKKELRPMFKIPQLKTISQALGLIVRKTPEQVIEPTQALMPNIIEPQQGGLYKSKRRRYNKKIKNRTKKRYIKKSIKNRKLRR